MYNAYPAVCYSKLKLYVLHLKNKFNDMLQKVKQTNEECNWLRNHKYL